MPILFLEFLIRYKIIKILTSVMIESLYEIFLFQQVLNKIFA